jgi:hypothetical protein
MSRPYDRYGRQSIIAALWLLRAGYRRNSLTRANGVPLVLRSRLGGAGFPVLRFGAGRSAFVLRSGPRRLRAR